MSEFTNSAKRILKLVEQLADKPDQPSAAQVWAEVFGLDAEKANTDPHVVYTRLNLVREEVDLIDSLMRDTKFSEILYEPYLSRVRKAVSVNNINASWNNYKNNLQPDTILALKYCAEILPSEPLLAMEELQGVLDKVYELRQEINNCHLSRGIRDFLISQLSIIERGILEYPIKGSSAIKRAFHDGFSDLASHADNLEKEEDKVEASKVAGIWSSLKTAGKEFVEADRIASAYINLIEKGQAVSKVVIMFLNSDASQGSDA